jgi:hypothetical protein
MTSDNSVAGLFVGEGMNKILSDEDRLAIDLLLDPQAMPNGSSYVPPSPKRVQSVEKVFSLLQQMPTHDPPKDLTTRTLRKVNQSPESEKTDPAAIAPAAETQRPTA